MSFFNTIIKDVESFAATAERDFLKLWASAPKLDQIALTTITYVGPILETVFTLEAGAPAGALVTAIIDKVQSDLIAAKGLIQKIGPTPSVGNILAGASSDLSSLLTAANVTNPQSVASVKLVVGELNALVASFAPATPAAA